MYKQIGATSVILLWFEGTDLEAVSLFEFDMNARIANNLGAPILAVINGFNKTQARLLMLSKW